MSKSLTDLSAEELRELLQASRQTLTSLVESLANRPDMQNAIRRLMRPVQFILSWRNKNTTEPEISMRELDAAGVQGEVATKNNLRIQPGGDNRAKRSCCETE